MKNKKSGQQLSTELTELERQRISKLLQKNPRTAEIESELFKLCEKLIKASAKRHYKTLGEWGRRIELKDLTSVGTIAFLNALNKYKEEKGDFVHFASVLIKFGILDHINDNQPYDGFYDNKTEIERTITKFKKDGVFDPTADQIAQVCGVSLIKVKEILFETFKTVSLQDRISSPEGMKVEETIRASDTCNPEQYFISKEDKKETLPLKLEEVGLINRNYAKNILKEYNRDKDHEGTKQFKKLLNAHNFVFKKKQILTKGAEGKLDLSILKEIHTISTGKEVLDRRKTWKARSPF